MANDSQKNNFTLCLSIFSLLMIGSLVSFFLFRPISNNDHTYNQIEKSISKIEYFDEVLTMSSRMNILEKDQMWKNKYEQTEKLLNSELEKLGQLVANKKNLHSFFQTVLANDILVKMEKESFELVQAGEYAKAKDILFSEDYNKNKRKFAESLAVCSEVVKVIKKSTSGKIKELIVDFLLLDLLIAFLGFLFWVKVFRNHYIKIKSSLFEATNTLSSQRKAIDSVVIVAETDPRGIITYINDAFCRISGHSREELIGSNHRILSSGHHTKEFIKNMWSTILAGRPWHGEIKNKTKNGDFYWVDTTIAPIFGDDGEIVKFISLRYDITEIVRTKEELQNQKLEATLLYEVTKTAEESLSFEEALQHCLDIVCELTNWPIGHIYLRDTQNGDLLVSSDIWSLKDKFSHQEFVNITSETNFLIGKGLPGRILETKCPLWISNIQEDHNYHRNKVFEDRNLKGAFAFPVILNNDVVAVLEFYSEEEVFPNESLLLTVKNLGIQLGRVLERKRNKEEINRHVKDHALTRKFLESIVENIPAMIFLKDAKDLRFELLNRAGEELLGLSRDQLIGKNDHDLFASEQATFFVKKDREVLKSKKNLKIAEERLDSLNGQKWLHTLKVPILDDKGVPQYLLGISIDITDKKNTSDQLEELNLHLEERVKQRSDELQETQNQLRQAQKMEALGQLSGGIAHDFNNKIAIIIMGLHILRKRIKDTSQVEVHINNILRAADGASQLTKQLLTFSRKDIIAPKSIDLNEMLEHIHLMLGRLVGEDINFELQLENEKSNIIFDEGQLDQIIMNLVINAKDAMPNGGDIIISTKEGDDYIKMTVSDTGEGIPEDKLDKIFEPFYTSKEEGKGTGLGLATVLGIVQQNKGEISVTSQVGVGTTFTIQLPKQISTTNTHLINKTDNINNFVAKEKILVVEDEDVLRDFIKTVLESEGFEVFTFSNAHDALDELNSGPIPDLIITDVVMPRMSGRVFAEEAKKIHPSAKIIFMSGYTNDELIRKGVQEKEVILLQKPLTPKKLCDLIKKVLIGKIPLKESA